MECVATSTGVCGPEYWLAADELRCIGSCFLEDDGKYRS